MKKWVWFVLILCSGLYVSCTLGDDVSGSSFETENSIAFEVVLTNKHPAAHTDVIIRPSDYVARSKNTAKTDLAQGIWNGKTDENGKITINNLPNGKYVIETRNDSLKGVMSFELDSTDLKGVNLIMKKPGTVFGSVVLPPEYRRAKVGIVGLDYFALTDSTGSFEFESLPADTFSIVALMESESSAFTQFASSSVAVVSGESTEINIGVNGKMDSVTVVDSLFYEDFEDSTKGWYTSAANYATADLSAVLEEDRDELVAYFTYTNDSTNGWALMGHSFDGVQDLSNLDSVSFMARGDGRVSLAFDHWDDVDSAFTDKAWIHIEINSSWTRYVVKPSDFLKADSIGGNTGWDSVKKAVTNITFFGNNGKEFWLDDIVLYSTKRVLKGIE